MLPRPPADRARRAALLAMALAAALAAGGCDALAPALSVRAQGKIDWSLDPLQTPTRRSPFQLDTSEGAMTISPRFEFDVAAKVASAESYRFDGGAFLSPVDLVLLWGHLPDEPYRGAVSYHQMTRYFFWHTDAAGLDLHYIASHAANMHMIPSKPNLRRALLKVHGGDAVRIHGLLVDVSRGPGFVWRTSVSREDTGPGACEVVWVESLQRDDRLYL